MTAEQVKDIETCNSAINALMNILVQQQYVPEDTRLLTSANVTSINSTIDSLLSKIDATVTA